MKDDWERRLLRIEAQLRVDPSRTDVDLARDYDPRDTVQISHRKRGRRLLAQTVETISDYQRRLAAQERDRVLVVIQALDAAGKDGTVRHMLSGVNPAGVSVTSFKQPTAAERAHGFLWRYEQHLPGPGQIAVFNRSQYEEVLVVRVHPQLLVDEHDSPSADVWQRRYDAINQWEHDLTTQGVRIVKLLLNVSAEQQRIRFLRRLDFPEKHWKFSAADIRERAYWNEYQYAMSQMLSHTSTEWAPWHVVPADRKWFARLACAAILMGALVDIDPQIPQPDAAQQAQLDAARAELEAQAPRGRPADPVAEDPDRYR